MLKNDWTRRTFLQTMGSAVPTLKQVRTAERRRVEKTFEQQPDSRSKFTPIDLSSFFNASAADFGPREQAKKFSGDSARDGLIRTPGGRQSFRGIPFALGKQGIRQKSWVAIGLADRPWTTRSLQIPIQENVSFVCLAAFCDWDANETPTVGEDVIERLGQPLAQAIWEHSDGGSQTVSIRRCFEVHAPEMAVHRYGSLPHQVDQPRKPTDALSNAKEWGTLQTGVASSDRGPDGRPLPTLWISALPNPEPARRLKALRLEAQADDSLLLCGLTLFRGRENPLRYERLSVYRITLPEATAEDEDRWKVDVDLGVVARRYTLPDFNPEVWLSDVRKGQGEVERPVQGSRHLYVEVAASSEATLALRDTKLGQHYAFDLGQAIAGQELAARTDRSRIEILDPRRVWLHGEVSDAGTHRPTPVRLAFRSKEGRYLPPYGHRTEINDGWFQDYGADVKLLDSSFAYVDGTFQVELPVGEVYVEMTKGFEYEPIRQKLTIEPGQRQLKLQVGRFADLRSKGWINADTHVHFLSPSTALLEAQAEGLNLINLLAAQWGGLFSNVGDFSYGPLTSGDGEAMVWIGTENRQHILGHLSLMGHHGGPIYPMSASGPGESYLGDPLWNSMAEWADACRQREGLVVAPHFSNGRPELAADLVLGKIDAIELIRLGHQFDAIGLRHWYRYLNCGYRVPLVGGTDKMDAAMPAGARRTYAYLGQEEFSFANWAKAVRRGNTFNTSGPLIFFSVDGHLPGAEIKIGSDGGTVEVRAEASSVTPFHRLEIVLNGRVVASREEIKGSRQMILQEKLQVPGPAWLAARCSSRLEPTVQGLALTAHTSAVYLVVPGKELFSAPIANYLLTVIAGAQNWVQNLATRPDPERFARAQKVLEDARTHLHQRLHQHGIAH